MPSFGRTFHHTVNNAIRRTNTCLIELIVEAALLVLEVVVGRLPS
jgi:hypothetical protein